jgi:hypothetical protein
MTYNEVKFFVELVAVIGGLIGWFSVKTIEKRLGCENDWEFMGLVCRKINLLWSGRKK